LLHSLIEPNPREISVKVPFFRYSRKCLDGGYLRVGQHSKRNGELYREQECQENRLNAETTWTKNQWIKSLGFLASGRLTDFLLSRGSWQREITRSEKSKRPSGSRFH
jgi:hypothetical protein